LSAEAKSTSSRKPARLWSYRTISATATNGLDVRSSIRLDQIRTVDRLRLIRRLGALDAVAMDKVDGALKISLGLTAL
jgi:mRNA-degrading endonuclease toxin of MazEF toxin-antitoxin module